MANKIPLTKCWIDVQLETASTLAAKYLHCNPEIKAEVADIFKQCAQEVIDSEGIENLLGKEESGDKERVRSNIMMTMDGQWDKAYKSAQAYDYEKREETLTTSNTSEEALKNAYQLIESEKMAKLKAERKEAKKKRQKEKKRADKEINDNGEKKSASNSTSLNDNVTTKSNNIETAEESEDESLDYFDQEEDFDDEFLDVNAAFVKKASIKHNKKVSSNKTSSPKPEKISPSLESMSTQMPKFEKPRINKTNHETAETFGIQGYYIALNSDDFNRATNCFSQAIFIAPEDVRHLHNRSYCYLRLGQYSLALNDAQLAKKNAQSMEDFAKAVAREGQALFGLQQYHEAEKCFEEILKLGQGNEWILTELILARVLQLANMGFSKIDALKALQQCSTVVDAVTLLTSGNIVGSDIESSVDKSETKSCDGDEIYFSDDESSSTILLSKVVSTIAHESCYFENLRAHLSSPKEQQYNSSERILKGSSSMESVSYSSSIKSNGSSQWEVMSNSKFIPSTSKTDIRKPIISDSSSIWVGSIDKTTTDHKLRELFSIFGTINYIRRFPDKRYVFIDFDSKRAATKALNNTNDFEINGVKLPIKPVKNKKPF